MLNINIHINLISINFTDQLDPYDLRITLRHTQHKCEESARAVLTFLKNAECTSNNVGCTISPNEVGHCIVHTMLS